MARNIATANQHVARNATEPYPITWEEQDRLFSEATCAIWLGWSLFAVNTGARESNVCALGMGVGGSRARDQSKRVRHSTRSVQVQTRPRRHLERRRMVHHRVATRHASDLGLPLSRQTGCHDEQHGVAARPARRRAASVRIHDLRHTFGCRLRAAGVSVEDREALLGHANHSMAGHYASADVGRLLKQANLILNREETRTVLRVANAATALWIKGPAKVPQQRNEPRLRLVSP